VSNLKGSWMLLDGLENSDSTNVVSSSEHHSGSILELNDTLDFSSVKVDLNQRFII
jgi:hypothetical protein